MSARISVLEKGDYKIQGKNGPSNWETFNICAKTGQFGYVLLPAGMTGDAARQLKRQSLARNPRNRLFRYIMAKASEFAG